MTPGRPPRLSVTLTAAPPPPPAPKPEPGRRPPPPVPDGNYSPSTTSIPDFVESNYIGSAPVKRSPVGCGAHSTSTLMQTKDPIAEHTHADADETIYVVAGEGMHRVGGHVSTPVSAGIFAVVPRGTPHSLTRRGSRPLIFVSTLSRPAVPVRQVIRRGIAATAASSRCSPRRPRSAQPKAIRFKQLWDGSAVIDDATVIVDGERIVRVESGANGMPPGARDRSTSAATPAFPA